MHAVLYYIIHVCISCKLIAFVFYFILFYIILFYFFAVAKEKGLKELEYVLHPKSAGLAAATSCLRGTIVLPFVLIQKI